MLNPDLVFLPGCVEALYGHVVANPMTGAAGPVGFWDRGREVRLPPNILPTLGDLFAVTLAHVSPAWNRRYVERRLRHALPVYLAEDDVTLDMLSGACLMIPRAVVDELGMFFDDGFPLYYEDTDLFRRIEGIGRRLVCVGTAHIAHFYNRSGTTDPEGAMARYWRARSYYYGKWYGLVGRACEALCRRLVRTDWARRRAGVLRTGIIDLGDVDEPPVLELGHATASATSSRPAQDQPPSWPPRHRRARPDLDAGRLVLCAFGDSELFTCAASTSAGASRGSSHAGSAASATRPSWRAATPRAGCPTPSPSDERRAELSGPGLNWNARTSSWPASRPWPGTRAARSRGPRPRQRQR
ncbi:MAG: hypothetical protein R3F30_01740 [Planctomycetota bacterium]